MSKATSPLLLPEDARPSDTLKLKIVIYFHVCLSITSYDSPPSVSRAMSTLLLLEEARPADTFS